MSTRKIPLPRQAPNADDVAPNNYQEHDDRASSSKPAARTTGGRFAPGHCPNPKGRPRKKPEAGTDLINRILDELIATGGAGRGQTMSMREALVRSLCARGCKDSTVALALLKYDASCRQTARITEAPENAETTRAMLRRYVERENRRKALPNEEANAREDDDEHEI